jgi:hypothetical protein
VCSASLKQPWVSNGITGNVAGPTKDSIAASRQRGSSNNIARGSTGSGGGGVTILSPPSAPPAGRLAALHWLHQVLLHAFHACQVGLHRMQQQMYFLSPVDGFCWCSCLSHTVHVHEFAQGNPLMLSPLNLRTSEAAKVAAALGGHAAAAAASSSGYESGPPSSGGAAGQPPTRWTACLADVLLHVVREAAGGCRLVVAAVGRAAADLKRAAGSGSDVAGCQRLVMGALYVALLWVLQAGDSQEGSDRWVW